MKSLLLSFLLLISFSSLAQTSVGNCDISITSEEVKACASSRGLSEESCSQLVSAQCLGSLFPVKTPIKVTTYYLNNSQCSESNVDKEAVVFAEDTKEERRAKCQKFAEEAIKDHEYQGVYFEPYYNTSLDRTSCESVVDFTGETFLKLCMKVGRKIQ
jgi:hypothetical protein